MTDANTLSDTQSLSITVGTVGLPDLVAGPLTVTPAAPTTSQTVTIQGSINNAGSETTGGAFSWEMRVDGTVVASGRPANLAAGGTLTDAIKAVNIGPYGEGTHQVQLIVDTGDEISESTNDNNTSYASFTVPGGGGGWGPPCTTTVGGDSYESDNCVPDAVLLTDPNETGTK